jgi:hypothetical protein
MTAVQANLVESIDGEHGACRLITEVTLDNTELTVISPTGKPVAVIMLTYDQSTQLYDALLPPSLPGMPPQ